jgi:hypothetical protein
MHDDPLHPEPRHPHDLDEATVRHLLDPRATPAPEVAHLEALLRPLGEGAASPPSLGARPSRAAGARAALWPVGAVAALLLLAVGAAVLLSRPGAAPTAPGGWAWTRTSAGHVEQGQLAVGHWLETGEHDTAELIVPSLGTVDLGPRSRLRLVGNGRDGRRLELAEGRLEAVVDAPPRLFVVDTPSAAAVDMGCAYVLDVDAHGNGWLEVTAGWVALEAARGAVHVPAGARCRLRAGVGPGLPYFEGAPEAVRAAIATLEDGGDRTAALDMLLEAARDLDDALVLAHALPYADGDLRTRLLDRATTWAPLPEDVDRAEVLALDAGAFERWFDAALR